MAIVSIGDLLDRAGAFEEQLGKYYAGIRDASKDDGVRLLTYYLSRHRRHLQGALKDLTAGEIERIRSVRLKYDIQLHPEKDFHLIETSPCEVKGEELLNAAVEYDFELIGLYKKILQQPLGPEVSAFVESLIRVEERDIVMVKKMLAMHYF
ncbi:MAG: hypothetical protein V1800_01455 [Candidatus Latescibacterota bacterium]